MKTAEEKREVAESLREQAAHPGSSSMYMEAFIEDLRQIIDPYNMSNSYADLYDILADLIEPSETEQGVASQGLTKEQLEFDWWLSGRVMHELGFDGDTADHDEVERRLLARLTPEGMEWLFEVWPKWSNGEYCKFGDWWVSDNYGEPNPKQFRKLSIYTPEQLREWEQDEGDNFGYEWDFMRPADTKYRPNKVEPPAPKVYDADGAEIRVGDECYVVSNGDGPYVVDYIRETDGAIDMHWHKNKNDVLHVRPDLITHRAPVLAADGRPLREGDKPYRVDNSKQVEVRRVDPDYGEECVFVGVNGTSLGYWLRPDQLTHERPDSWERLEEDASKETCRYFGSEHCDCSTCKRLERSVKDCGTAKARDLVRRAKRLGGGKEER